MPNKHIKRGSTSPNIKEIKIKTVIWYTSNPLQLSKEKKKEMMGGVLTTDASRGR